MPGKRFVMPRNSVSGSGIAHTCAWLLQHRLMIRYMPPQLCFCFYHGYGCGSSRLCSVCQHDILPQWTVAHLHIAEQQATSTGQYPAAIVLSCIDSRAPAEVITNLGIGDIFNARVAGNIANDDILGSMEFACKVAGSKVVLVSGAIQRAPRSRVETCPQDRWRNV